MSFISIPNQPIIFHPKEDILTPCEECGESNYKQLVDFNDQIFYQIETTPCEDLTFSALYPFDIETGGWGNNATQEKVCSTNVNQAGVYYINFNTQYVYQLYQVTFTVLSLDQGTLNVTMDYSTDFQITLAGTYTLYFANPQVTNNTVQVIFQTTTNGWQGCLSTNVRLQGLASVNQMRVGIVDATTLETIDVITPTYILKDNKITTAFDLINVDVGLGCYRLAMADFCTNTCGQSYIFNGVFRTLPRAGIVGWDIGEEFGGFVTLTEGNALFDLSYEDSGAFLISNSVELCTGLTYNVTLTLGSAVNAAMTVGIGDNQVQVPIQTGTQTISIVAGEPTLSNGTHLIISGYQSGGGGGFINLLKVEVSVAPEDTQWDLYSDILDIGDYNDSCKYFKIEGCNAQDQFNLAFGGSSFLPMIRIEGKRSKAQYVTNANTFRYASGKWTANYVNRLKQWTYHFGRLPEYVLDFLSTIFYYDNCYVNGVLMFPQDNAFPTIDWSDADSYLGSFNIDLVEKENKVVKVQCTDADANCLPSILDNSQEPFLLTQDGNRITTQDSVNLYYEY